MQTEEEIYTKVSATLVEALNVDEEDIKPTSTLQGDLGAESIDFLDIVFRLEREFGIKIPRGELFPESIFQGDPDLVQDGRVTDKGLNELRTKMPFADISKFEANPELSNPERPVHGRVDRTLHPGKTPAATTGTSPERERREQAGSSGLCVGFWVDRFVAFPKWKIGPGGEISQPRGGPLCGPLPGLPRDARGLDP